MKYRKNETSTNGLDQATLVAGLAALGEDSSESEFNEITGLRLKVHLLFLKETQVLRDKGKWLSWQIQLQFTLYARNQTLSLTCCPFINRYPSQLLNQHLFRLNLARHYSYCSPLPADQADGEDLILKDDLIVEITRVVQSLLPKSALCEYGLKSCASVHYEDSAIMKAQSLLFKVFDIYGAASDRAYIFEHDPLLFSTKSSRGSSADYPDHTVWG
jgi:hypothetical protein